MCAYCGKLALHQLCEEELQRKIQAELEKKRKVVAERWKRMAKKLLVKQHLKQNYEALQAKHHGEEEEVTHSVEGEAKPETELTITLDKAQLESRRGKELRHTHTFGEERCVDAEEDLWEKTCTQCGYVLSFEKM